MRLARRIFVGWVDDQNLGIGFSKRRSDVLRRSALSRPLRTVQLSLEFLAGRSRISTVTSVTDHMQSDGAMALTTELKLETAAPHRSLEELPSVRRPGLPEATYDDYVVMARYLLPRLYPLEVALAPFARDLGFTRDAVDPLRRELEALELPVPVALPRPRDPCYLMALLYVLEGSSLGARYLMASWEKKFSAADLGALHYYRYLAGLPAARWGRVKEFIDSRAFADADRATVIAHAKNIFAYLGGDDGIR